VVAKAYVRVCMYVCVACHVKNVNSTRGRSPLPLVKPNLGGDMPGSPDPGSMPKKKKSLLLQYPLTAVNFPILATGSADDGSVDGMGGRINGRAGGRRGSGRTRQQDKEERESEREAVNERAFRHRPPIMCSSLGAGSRPRRRAA